MLLWYGWELVTVPYAGQGRVHACLWDNKDKLTEECRREELKLKIIQSRDIRLRPKLHKLCSEEIAVFCKDVKPGDAAPKQAKMLSMHCLARNRPPPVVEHCMPGQQSLLSPASCQFSF